MKNSFTEGRLRSPANDHRLFTCAPTCHGPQLRIAAAAGPISHFPDPRLVADAEGNCSTGPIPQMKVSALGGERNNVGWMSPMPKVYLSPGAPGSLTNGTIVRVMSLHSPGSEIGMLDWTLNTYSVSRFAPTSKLKLD